jgi:hypothetical protein
VVEYAGARNASGIHAQVPAAWKSDESRAARPANVADPITPYPRNQRFVRALDSPMKASTNRAASSVNQPAAT